MTINWSLVLLGAAAAAFAVGITRHLRGSRGAAFGAPTLLAALGRLPAPAGLSRRLAAMPGSSSAHRVLGQGELGTMRAGAVVAGGALAFMVAVVAPSALPILVVLPVAAVGIPDALSIRIVREARRALVEQLPDALDLLAVSTRAGMTTDRAIDLVAERLGGPFRQEFERVRHAIELGGSRRSALEELALRTKAEPVEHVCAALIRADELGTPVADTLERLAGAMRHARSQQARERAAKAGPKIQLVVALLMVPATLLLVIGLLLIELARQVNAVIGAG